MIRTIGKKEDPHEYMDMMESRLRSMEELSSTHITWYTHKNPYGCWICDMFVLGQRVIDSFREFLGESPATAEKGQPTLSERLSDNESYDEEDADASLRGEQEG